MKNTIMPIEKLISEIGSLEYSDKKCCYRNCSEKPIISHTISENYLYKLNPDLNAVQTFQPDLCRIIAQPDPELMVKVTKKKFSTFVGFCRAHDNNLFKKIDSFDGKIDNEIATLVHYRNICYGINHIKAQKMRLRHLAQQNYTRNNLSNDEHEKIVKLLKGEVLLKRLNFCLTQHERRKKTLESMIDSNDFADIICFWLPGTLDNPIFSGRSTFILHRNESIFKYPGYGYMPWISYMTLLTQNQNYLVFCWLKSDAKFAKKLRILAEKIGFKDILAVLAYGSSDAFAVEKSFHNKHSSTIQKILKNLRSY